MSTKSVEVTTKHLWGAVAAVVTSMAGMVTVHTQLMVPAIMNDVRIIVEGALDSHTSREHPSAVSDGEFHRAIGRLEAEIKELRREQ